MHKIIEQVTVYLDAEGINYNILGDDQDAISIEQHLKGISPITKHVVIADDENDEEATIQIKVYRLAHVPSPSPEFYKLLNDLNDEYRWYKFYLDKDNDIVLSADATVNKDDPAPEIWELLARGCRICKDAYPKLMRGIWA